MKSVFNIPAIFPTLLPGEHAQFLTSGRVKMDYFEFAMNKVLPVFGPGNIPPG
jgi:hypothetical protein